MISFLPHSRPVNIWHPSPALHPLVLFEVSGERRPGLFLNFVGLTQFARPAAFLLFIFLSCSCLKI